MERNVEINGTNIIVKVDEVDGEHIIWIDGVEWVRTTNYVHAAVLFNMIADHITEYVNYQPK